MATTITERALVARLRRSLAQDGKALHKCRQDSKWHRDLGDWYCVDDRNNICGPAVDNLEELGRERGVLRPGEILATSASVQ
jgi:hypothetical protein